MQYERSSDVRSKPLIDVEVDRQEMAAVDVLELPIGQPHVVALRNRPIVQGPAPADRAIEHTKAGAGPAPGAGEIDRTVRDDGGGRHEVEPFAHVEVIASAVA